MIYNPAYRCLCCDTIILGPETEMSRESASKDVNKIASLQSNFSNRIDLGVPPQTIIHNCSDGSVGVAIFAGMRIKDNDFGYVR